MNRPASPHGNGPGSGRAGPGRGGWVGGGGLTGQDGEDGGEGVEFEPVDDVAGVEELEAHEAEADHQQQDVENLGHHRQPQHTCNTQQQQQEHSQPVRGFQVAHRGERGRGLR